MATDSKQSGSVHGAVPWRARAKYQVGKTRRQRQAQHRQQANALLIVLMAALVVGVLIVLINWQNAGSTKSVSCDAFPQYCVPLAGGSADFPNLEAASVRTLNKESSGAAGVVRGVADGTVPFIGNPNAPIHFIVVADFACSHCNTYHTSDLDVFIKNEVMAGKATVGMMMTTGTGGLYSQAATSAALCAGEQGAYWEMSDEIFRLARSQGVQSGFALTQLQQSANAMGLDGDKLLECISSNRYANVINGYQTFAMDHGVTGTPALLVSYDDSGEWILLQYEARAYANMKALTDAAQAAAQ